MRIKLNLTIHHHTDSALALIVTSSTTWPCTINSEIAAHCNTRGNKVDYKLLAKIYLTWEDKRWRITCILLITCTCRQSPEQYLLKWSSACICLPRTCIHTELLKNSIANILLHLQ